MASVSKQDETGRFSLNYQLQKPMKLNLKVGPALAICTTYVVTRVNLREDDAGQSIGVIGTPASATADGRSVQLTATAQWTDLRFRAKEARAPPFQSSRG